MSKQSFIRRGVLNLGLAAVALSASSGALDAAPVVVNSGFQGGTFGTFGVNFNTGASGLQIQQIRFDLQNPLFTDPTFNPPGALLPLPFLSLTGVLATGYSGYSGIADGSTSFTLFFDHFDVGESFLFELDVDTPCGGLLCQWPASQVTGAEFAGTTITAIFGGERIPITELSGIFARTGQEQAAAQITGDIQPVPEPQSLALIGAGLIALTLKMRGRKTTSAE